MGDIKARLRRYRIAVLAGSGIAGIILFLGWRWLLLEGHKHGTPWIKNVEDFHWFVVVAIIAGPFLVALFWHDRARSKLLGIESVGAKLKRQSAEEKSAVTWALPRQSAGRNWRMNIRIAVCLAAATFVIMFMMCLIGGRIREHVYNFSGSLGVGLFCACVVLIGSSIQSRFSSPRVQLTLISDGLIVSATGGTKDCIPYSAIQRVCIKPLTAGTSPDRCLVILVNTRRGNRWLAYDFGDNAPVEEIKSAFEAKGFHVEIGQQRPNDGSES